MRRPGVLRVDRQAQLSTLRSPVRLELLDAMTRVDAVSLAEIGALIGRPSDGLYYHVRALERVGLVRPAGTRVVNGRSEALYRSAASEFTLRYTPVPPRRAAAVNGIIAAMMRLGARDFRRALGGEGVRLEGPERDLWAMRTTGWLRPADVRRVNALIRRLAATAARGRRPGRLYAITALFAPLDHRKHTDGRRRRKERPR